MMTSQLYISSKKRSSKKRSSKKLSSKKLSSKKRSSKKRSSKKLSSKKLSSKKRSSKKRSSKKYSSKKHSSKKRSSKKRSSKKQSSNIHSVKRRLSTRITMKSSTESLTKEEIKDYTEVIDKYLNDIQKNMIILIGYEESGLNPRIKHWEKSNQIELNGNAISSYTSVKNTIRYKLKENKKWKKIIINLLKSSNKWVAKYVLINLKKNKYI